jgi:hypothetical protein
MIALPKPAKPEKPQPSRIRRSAPIARTAVRKAPLSTRRGQARKADKRSRIAKRPKASRKKAVLYADSLWSQIIRRRSATCETCGTRPTTQAAHGIDRGYFGTRWDLRNGFASCGGCNRQAFYRKQAWTQRLRLELFGPALFDELWALALRPAKAVSLPDVTRALEAVLHMGVDVPTLGGEA